MNLSYDFEAPCKISFKLDKKYYKNQILCLLNFSMSTAVTRVFFFKPIIGGERCLRGDVGGWALGAPQPRLGRAHSRLGWCLVFLVVADHRR